MHSVTFVVPSLDEELNVECAVEEIRAACKALNGRLGAVELILVNDGSNDRTAEIINRLAAKHPDTRCIHNERSLGLGGAYKRGAVEATHEYVMWVPGENTVPAMGLRSILSEIGNADLVIPYPLNPGIRTFKRRLISGLFNLVVRLISPYRIRYYNGPGLIRRNLVLSALPQTSGHAFQLELIVTLLNRGHSYLETGMVIRDRMAGESKAIRLANLVAVIGTFGRLGMGMRRKSRESPPDIQTPKGVEGDMGPECFGSSHRNVR